jgi:hypothetical protein
MLPALIALSGLILPPELGIYVGNAALPPGRLGILLLLVPALIILIARRRLILADYLVLAAALWMTGAAISVSGVSAVWSAPGGESLELFGSYAVGRAFFFTPTTLNAFLRTLKCFALIVIILAVVESLEGRLIVRDTFASMVGAKSATSGAIYRDGFVRAVSTFEHPILFGSFCPIALVLMLYWETSSFGKIAWAGLSLAGCLASLTSIALLSYLIVVLLYSYDQIMKRYRWRWTIVWALIASVLSILFIFSNAPLGWLITHLTFDPESGYFRFLIWDAATTYISQAPFAGYAYTPLHHPILDYTVDSVWLVTALRYGIPMVLLLFLANIATIYPVEKTASWQDDRIAMNMSTAFTIAIVLFMFIGLTVHYWNFMWIFWALCLGISGSLKEAYLQAK